MKYKIGDEFIIECDGIAYQGKLASMEGDCLAIFSWKYPDKHGDFKYHRNVVTEEQIDKHYSKGLIT